MMKGILLAGGRGTRLYPLTAAVSKQLLPVYSKPMVMYPLSVLMMTGIREVLVITTPEDQRGFETLLGDGRPWGMRLTYAVQPVARGLAEALVIGRDFLEGSPCCLVLGDNLFHGAGLIRELQQAAKLKSGAMIFGYPVKDAREYGVVEFNARGRAISIEEKPAKPRSHYAVPGLYFYDGKAADMAAKLRPSPRGELEITDLNLAYLKQGKLKVRKMSRGVAWMDAGTPEALLQAGLFVQAIETRQGEMIACPEELAYRMGFISRAQLGKLAAKLQGSYGRYVRSVWAEG